jgi:hypothetical protein
VLAEFDIRDRAGLELLSQAAACLDRAEMLSEPINADGAVVRTRNACGRILPYRMKRNAVPLASEFWKN